MNSLFDFLIWLFWLILLSHSYTKYLIKKRPRPLDKRTKNRNRELRHFRQPSGDTDRQCFRERRPSSLQHQGWRWSGHLQPDHHLIWWSHRIQCILAVQLQCRSVYCWRGLRARNVPRWCKHRMDGDKEGSSRCYPLGKLKLSEFCSFAKL